jgi:hypothetical protein
MTTNGNAGITSELDERVWSVLTSRGVFARSVTYASAQMFVDKIFAQHSDMGLCIITDEAANRFRKMTPPDSPEENGFPKMTPSNPENDSP